VSTARDLIKGSLRLIGAIATGETPSADELTDALAVLNDMLDSWSLENLTLYQRSTREELSWTSGQQSRTWGASGTFTSARPVDLEFAAILQSSTEYPLQILSPGEWAQLKQKTLTGSLPTAIYIEGSYPNATMYLWPVPNQTITLVTHTLKPLSSFATANDTVSLPPGYSRAIRFNLAIELAPEYGKSISEQILISAQEAKENIKRKNSKPRYLAVDAALLYDRKRFNILTGE
jgi:hypothetical protein